MPLLTACLRWESVHQLCARKEPGSAYLGRHLAQDFQQAANSVQSHHSHRHMPAQHARCQRCQPLQQPPLQHSACAGQSCCAAEPWWVLTGGRAASHALTIPQAGHVCRH